MGGKCEMCQKLVACATCGKKLCEQLNGACVVAGHYNEEYDKVACFVCHDARHRK